MAPQWETPAGETSHLQRALLKLAAGLSCWLGLWSAHCWVLLSLFCTSSLTARLQSQFLIQAWEPSSTKCRKHFCQLLQRSGESAEVLDAVWLSVQVCLWEPRSGITYLTCTMRLWGEISIFPECVMLVDEMILCGWGMGVFSLIALCLFS